MSTSFLQAMLQRDCSEMQLMGYPRMHLQRSAVEGADMSTKLSFVFRTDAQMGIKLFVVPPLGGLSRLFGIGPPKGGTTNEFMRLPFSLSTSFFSFRTQRFHVHSPGSAVHQASNAAWQAATMFSGLVVHCRPVPTVKDRVMLVELVYRERSPKAFQTSSAITDDDSSSKPNWNSGSDGSSKTLSRVLVEVFCTSRGPALYALTVV